MADNRFRTREIAIGKGRLRTADDPATIGPEDVSVAQNVRPSDQYYRGIGGMTKINTSALASTGIRNGFHFRKSQPAESHLMAWTSDGKVWKNDTAIPSQGAFSSALFTDAAGGSTGRFSPAPGGALAYANGVEACLWGGTEHRCAGFIDYPATGQIYDYSDLITNTKTDANNVATIHTSQQTADSATMLLLHLDNDVVDSSPTTVHTVTNNNVTFSTLYKKFGTHGSVFNGTTANLTVPDDADFNFSGGTFTVDLQVRSNAAGANQPLFYQANSGDANDYVRVYLNKTTTMYGYINLEIKTASSVVVTLTSSLVYFGNYLFPPFNHIAVVENGDDYYIFFNGSVVGYVSDNGRAANCTGTAYIGNDGSTNWFQGGIDEYRVSNSARWTSAFSPPSAAYGASYNSATYIGSIMPLDGVKFTVATANPLSSGAATMEMHEWNGDGWSALTITDNTALTSRALEQTGTVTWSSTASTSKPTVTEKLYLYWYKMVITSAADFGGTTLSHVTVSIPFQTVKNIWDSEERPLNSVVGKKSSVFYDFTSNVLENGYSSTGSAADVSTYAAIGAYSSSDEIYLGCIERLAGALLNIIDANVNTNASVMSVDYWSGSAWTALTINDGTSDGTKTLGKSGWVTWNSPSRTSEFKRSDLGAGRTQGATPGPFLSLFKNSTIAVASAGIVKSVDSMYYYRIKFSATLANTVNVYHIAGIPVAEDIRGYSFPMLHQNRPVLACNMDGAKNTIRLGATGTANVYNGLNSYEFPFGQEEAIVAGASLFLRFGSAVQDMLVLGKAGEIHLLEGNGTDSDPYRTRLLSATVGVRAPLTMTTVPVGDLGGGVRRQIAIWESQRGIEVFDGASLMDPLLSHDIRDKFDPKHANYAGSSANSGFYDPVYDEYHWCPVGTAEWVFSFKYKKWFQPVRGAAKYLYGGIPVMDTSGNSYVYGFDNAGYVYRLENGTDFDGNDIVHTLKTGAIALADNKISEETTLRMVKVVQVAKNTTANSMTVTHFGDTATSGNVVDAAFSPADATKRLKTRILNAGSKGPHVHHEFQLALTTDDEACGCEPIYIVAYYDGERQDVR